MYTPWESSNEQYYFLTWEIILGLINLYIRFFFKKSRTDESFVTKFSCNPQRSDRFDHWNLWWTVLVQCDQDIARRIQKNSTSIIIEYSGLFFRQFRKFVELRFKNCAISKRTSIICTSNLPSLLWNITSMVHKNPTTLKRRSNFRACIGKTVASTKLETPAFSKAAAAAAATAAAILHRLHPSRGKNWDYNFWRQTCRRHSDDTLIFRYVWFDTMVNPRGTVCTHCFEKKNLGRCHTNWEESYFQYWEEGWERIHVRGLIALPPPQKIQI